MKDLAPRRYEFRPDGSRLAALSSVVDDITAAAKLDIPFTVTTRHDRQFRHGGNVTKANVGAYVVEFGRTTGSGLSE